ncbi:MarR family winged helix-turn-helix transcriptional regulator [Falsarthrobacter nasiphocae]|uniref:DNA-binding MarR family transcriptional regulator n=1 Tax=Falsarthrobacter nasiphocae TaxID=189863 RepID=A0AAE3YE44_9MICC|nr:MarR family transcriptional regulator [Falsarthrobacter nasiphocae]MDR6891719.1 DNA-binding MarR family transcriptional regulator [Falsarthrobacter nasiphocae]
MADETAQTHIDNPEDIAFVLHRVLAHGDFLVRKLHTPSEMTASHMQLAEVLLDGPQSTVGLAQIFGFRSPTITGHVKAMLERGWVEKIPSTEDRRSAFISLTAAGEEAYQRELSRKLSALSRYLISIDAADRARIGEALELVDRELLERPIEF